jgi:hypothetical protein
MATNEKVGIELVADTRSLRTQLREATQDFIRLQESGTATAREINQAARRAADLKERIADAKDTIDAFNPEAKFKAFGQVVTGVAGAFSAAQGAMALMGVEGEEVQKTMLKVQGALALSEGLNTVFGLGDAFGNLSKRVLESSTFITANTAVTAVAGKVFKVFGLEVTATSTAFRVLKGAIAATGIGLLVIALGEAVSAFQKFSNGAEEAKKAQEELNKSVEKGAKAELEGRKEFQRREQELEIARAKRRGASEAEIFAIQDKWARIGINGQKQYYEEVKGIAKVGDEAEKDLLNAKATRDTNLINFQTEQIVKARERQAKATQESLQKIAEAEEAWVKESEKRFNRLTEFSNFNKSEYQLKLEELKKEYENDLILFQDNESAKLAAKRFYDNKVAEAKKENDEKIAEATKKAKEEADKVQEKNNEDAKKKQEKFNAGLTKVMDASIKKQKQDEVTITKLTEEQKLGIISGAVQTGIKLAGEGTVVGKALGIADATINTYVGASKALSTLPPPFSFIAAAATIAQGLMSVNSIINTKVPAGAGVSDSSGGASMPSAPAPIAPRGMEITPTTLDSRSLNTISNVVARAYVVESDITGSQQRIKRIENAARF